MPGRKLSPEERDKRAKNWFLNRIRTANTAGAALAAAVDYARSVFGGAHPSEVKDLVEELVKATDARKGGRS